jgi:hypothetical protein
MEVGKAKVFKQADQPRTGKHSSNVNETRQQIQSVVTLADEKKVTASDGQLLPIELEVYLLSFLNDNDFWNASRVCRGWRQAAFIAGQHKCLHLGHKRVDQQAVKTLVNMPFSRLFLQSCQLGVKPLTVLSQSTHLRELNLADNPEVGDEGAKALASGSLTSLTSLNLEGNQIGDEGAKAIGNGCLTSLISLNLERNQIGDEGAKAIANGQFTSLTSLNLKSNQIGDEGAKAIANGQLTSLTSLNLE